MKLRDVAQNLVDKKGWRFDPLPEKFCFRGSPRFDRCGVALVKFLSPGCKQHQAKKDERQRYQIQLKLDFDGLSYSGSERVRWLNHGERANAVLYFHLYSNLRPDQSSGAGPGSQPLETKSRVLKSPEFARQQTALSFLIRLTIRNVLAYQSA